MLPLTNIIISKFSSNNVALFGLRMSFPKEKNLSTAGLEGTGVLNFRNSRV
jgi:hypothetical protein